MRAIKEFHQQEKKKQLERKRMDEMRKRQDLEKQQQLQQQKIQARLEALLNGHSHTPPKIMQPLIRHRIKSVNPTPQMPKRTIQPFVSKHIVANPQPPIQSFVQPPIQIKHEALHQEYFTLQRQCHALRQECATLQSEKKEYQSFLRTANLGEKRKDVEQLQVERDQLQLQCSQYLMDIEEHKIQLQSLQTQQLEFAALQAQLKEVQSDLLVAQHEKEKIERNINRKKEALAAMDDSVQMKELNALVDRKNALQHELSDLQAKLAPLHHLLDSELGQEYLKILKL